MSSAQEKKLHPNSATVVSHEYQVLPVFNNLSFIFLAIPFAASVFVTCLFLHYAPTNTEQFSIENYLLNMSNIITVIQLLWCGFLIAVSVEATVKFRATQLPKWIGFDVGRTVFGTVNRIEVIICLLLLALRIFEELLKQQSDSLIPKEYTIASMAELSQMLKLAISNLMSGRLNNRFAMNMFPIVLLMVQVLYLQPILDARARQVIVQNLNKRYAEAGIDERVELANENRGAPATHFLYIAAEIAKISLLFWNSVRAMKLL